MFYSNQPVLPYFTAVVKNIASPNMEVKKLVYAFLIQHAEAAPDTALLSINTIQKGLSDSNPQTRALALRTMSSIRVPVISQIVALGIKRGAGDMSPIVRKTAALAIPKCYKLDTTHATLLEDQLAILLGDRQYYVAGAAVHAFLEVCPERLEMIHAHWRGLVKKLVDMDEWGQLATLELMLRYGRICFTRKTKKVRKGELGQPKSKGFYEDEKDSTLTETEEVHEVPDLDQDLELLLKAIQPLLQSRNSAVVMAVARCYLYLGTSSHINQLVGPLISILRAAPDISSVALTTIADIIRQHPKPFVSYTTNFLIRASDQPPMTESKLTILSLLFPYVSPSLRSLILTDLAHHTKSSSSPALIRSSVLAIGRCASTAPTPALRSRCLHMLLTQLSSPDSTLVAASLDEIRVLIQRDPAAHVKTVVRLAKHLDALTAPRARAAIVWLVGEYAAGQGSADIAADVWRILLKNFANETVAVQSQILLLAARVYLHHQRSKEKTQAHDFTPMAKPDYEEDRITKMLHYTFLLARYAHSFRLRDRARFLRALLLDAPSTDLAALLLLAAKPSPSGTSAGLPGRHHGKAAIGTASWLLGVDVRGTVEVPPWSTKDIGKDERGGGVDAPAQGTMGLLSRGLEGSGTRTPDSTFGAKKSNGVEKVSKTLDQWLDEEEVDEEEEDGSEEDTDDEEEDSEEEEETDSEEEEEEEDEDSDEDDHDERHRLVKT
jgi:AP-3 complex subunit beta